HTNHFNIKGMPNGVTGTPGVENYVNSINTSASGTFGTGGTALVSATTGFSNATPGGFLLASQGEGPDHGTTLTSDVLAPIVAAAIADWAAAGATAQQLAVLNGTHVMIGDLPNGALGNTTDDGTVTVDANAAGWGWFVDPTPAQNGEF